MSIHLNSVFVRASAIVLVLTIGCGTAQAAIATVGTGAGCTHSDLSSAVTAVEAQSGPRTIFIVDETFPSMADTVITQSMTIWGGLPTCAGPSPTGPAPVLIDADSGYAIRVSPPTGSGRIDVVLRNVELRGVDNQSGGGVDVGGNADVILDRVTIQGASHLTGGGLRVAGGSAGIPLVTLTGADEMLTTLWENHATTSGGGIACSDGAYVILERALLHDNFSGGDGGGIFLDDCTLEMGEIVEIEYNSTAGGGGAIAAVAGSYVWTIGAGYAFGSVSPAAHGGFLWADASDVRLENVLIGGGSNVIDGGFVHLSGGSSLEMVSNTKDCSPSSAGFCSALVAGSASGRGGALFLEDSELVLRNTDLSRNSAGIDGAAIHMENSVARLEGVRVVANRGPSILSVEGESSTELSLRYVTLAASENANFPLFISNVGGGGPVVEVLSSILWEPASPAIFGVLNGTAPPDMHCVLASSTVPGDEIMVADPLFADPGNRDYRLSVASPAIDFCDASRAPTEYPDFDLETRGTDQPGVDDRVPGAHYDLGYDEWFGFSQSVFLDGFESGDTSVWSITSP